MTPAVATNAALAEMDRPPPADEVLQRLIAEPFSVVASGAPCTPFLFASPHSGRLYPLSFLRSSRLDPLVSDVLPLAEWEKAVSRTRAGDGVKFVLEPGR